MHDKAKEFVHTPCLYLFPVFWSPVKRPDEHSSGQSGALENTAQVSENLESLYPQPCPHNGGERNPQQNFNFDLEMYWSFAAEQLVSQTTHRSPVFRREQRASLPKKDWHFFTTTEKHCLGIVDAAEMPLSGDLNPREVDFGYAFKLDAKLWLNVTILTLKIPGLSNRCTNGNSLCLKKCKEMWCYCFQVLNVYLFCGLVSRMSIFVSGRNTLIQFGGTFASNQNLLTIFFQIISARTASTTMYSVDFERFLYLHHGKKGMVFLERQGLTILQFGVIVMEIQIFKIYDLRVVISPFRGMTDLKICKTSYFDSCKTVETQKWKHGYTVVRCSFHLTIIASYMGKLPFTFQFLQFKGVVAKRKQNIWATSLPKIVQVALPMEACRIQVGFHCVFDVKTTDNLSVNLTLGSVIFPPQQSGYCLSQSLSIYKMHLNGKVEALADVCHNIPVAFHLGQTFVSTNMLFSLHSCQKQANFSVNFVISTTVCGGAVIDTCQFLSCHRLGRCPETFSETPNMLWDKVHCCTGFGLKYLLQQGKPCNVFTIGRNIVQNTIETVCVMVVQTSE